MSLTGLLLFATVYTLAVATPGPGIMALVARVLAHGRAGIWGFIGGYILGDLIWFTFAATGLAVIAQNFQILFAVIKYAGVAYLLYLAWRMWTAPVAAQVEPVEGSEPASQQFLASLTLTLGNPKVMVFFLAILPTIVDLQHLNLTAGLEIAALIGLLLTGTLALYVLAANKARVLFRTPLALRWLNRFSGGVIAAAAAAVASR